MAEQKTTVRTTRTKTTTELTIERDEFVLLRRRHARRGWCPKCSADVSLISAEEAAAALHVSVDTIYQLAEIGRLHFADGGAGQSLVCFGSFQASE